MKTNPRRGRTQSAILAAIALLVPLLLLAGTDISKQSRGVSLDFGAAEQVVFTGTFDGATNFVGASSTMLAAGSPNFDLGGGATLAFENVGAFNREDAAPADNAQALANDFFYAAGVGLSADPVSFVIRGVQTTDQVTVEFLGSVERGADVTFDGKTTTVPVGGNAFTKVGQVTGSTSYKGTFIGVEGNGEGNLSAARITIDKALGKPVATH